MNISSLKLINPEIISIVRIDKNRCKEAGSSYGKRVVVYYELDYITSGEGYIITDGKRIPAKRGTLFFREPGMIVEGIAPYQCYFLQLNLFKGVDFSLKEVQVNSTEDPLFPRVFMIDDPSLLEQLFNEIYNDYIQNEEMSLFTIKTNLMQIFAQVYRQWTIQETSMGVKNKLYRNNDKIYSAIRFIEENSHKHFSLNQLAARTGYSEYYFCRAFKKITGESMVAFVNRCKINDVRKKLIETEKSVKEIFVESGIQNESYFFRLFKNHTGTTPTEFRQKHRRMYS